MIRRFFTPISAIAAVCCSCFTSDIALAQSVARTPGTARLTEAQDKTSPPRSQNASSGKLRITLVEKAKSVDFVVREIARRANLKVLVDGDHPLPQNLISVNIDNRDVVEALSIALNGTGLVARLAGEETVIIRPAPRETTQEQETFAVSGRVVDSASGNGIGKVTVTVAGTRLGAIADDKGAYVIRGVPPGTYRLTFRILGYQSKTVSVTVSSSDFSVPTVLLRVTSTTLDDIVTTASGEARRREIGNDYTLINVEEVQREAPIASVTDMLEARVPGLTVLRTTGQPGDPSRIRLRGPGSITGNNDPIIIVDGVRMYSEQTGSRGGNLAQRGSQLSPEQTTSGGYPVPSPLDQIDPNIIETIEVLKGPSAGALYGSDAANGVIVIKTRRGAAGPSVWRLTANVGTSTLPGKIPNTVHIFGSDGIGGASGLCNISRLIIQRTCNVIDSLVSMQPLRDPEFTPLGRGYDYGLSANVSGGSQTLRYSFTAQNSNETGLLRLPRKVGEDYKDRFGFEAPGWMRIPDNYGRWSVQGQVTSQVSQKFQVTVSSILSKTLQKRTSLGLGAIPRIQEYYIPKDDPDMSSFVGFYDRVAAGNLNSIVSGNINWQPVVWLPITMSGGLNTSNRTDKFTQFSRTIALQAERYNVARGYSEMKTVSLNTRIPTFRDKVTVALGLNFVDQSVEDITSRADTVPAGVSIPTTGQSSYTTSNSTTSGWFVEPILNLQSRFFVIPGFRLDHNGLAGSNAKFNGFPKMNFSWVASEEDFFPWKNSVDMFRLRGAFGYAGVQPGPTQRHRLMWSTSEMQSSIYNVVYHGIALNSIGNTQLRPERSIEFEGGFDAELLNGRLSVILTQYSKTRHDAIIEAPLPLSLAINASGNPVRQALNIGIVRNHGTELTLSGQVLQSRRLGWFQTVSLSRYNNKVTQLAPGVEDISLDPDQSQRIVVGYPLFGRWGRPVAGFEDVNKDGIIDLTEIRLADSAKFLGGTEPKLSAAFNSNFSMLDGRLTFSSLFNYVHGLSQFLYRGSSSLPRGSDPYSWGQEGWFEDLARQAAILLATHQSYSYHDGMTGGIRTRWGMMQNVNTLRLQSISLNFALPSTFAEKLWSRSASVALQGSNVALWSNYMGGDPMVNTFTYNDRVADTGQLATPRKWSLRITLGQ